MFRLILLGAACGTYAWRVVDPVGSYAVLYDTAELITSLVIGNQFLQNLASLILVDEFNGFLSGIIFTSLLSLLWSGTVWLCKQPFRFLRKDKKEELPP